MATNPAPETSQAPRPVLKSTEVPIRQWIECERCLASSRDESSTQEWAADHLAERPTHNRFRIVSQTYWRLEPSDRAVGEEQRLCGVTKTFPDDETTKQIDPAWVGVTVTCDDAPHRCAPAEVVHSTVVLVDGKYSGVHYWGPGYRSENSS